MDKHFLKKQNINNLKTTVIVGIILIILVLLFIFSANSVENFIWKSKTDQVPLLIENTSEAFIFDDNYFDNPESLAAKEKFRALSYKLHDIFPRGYYIGMILYDKNTKIIWSDIEYDKIGEKSTDSKLPEILSGETSIEESKNNIKHLDQIPHLTEVKVPLYYKKNQSEAALKVYLNMYDIYLVAEHYKQLIGIFATAIILITIIVLYIISRKKNMDYLNKIQELNAIIKFLPVGIYTLNEKGIIESFNPEMVKMSGTKDVKEVIGLNALKFDAYKSVGLDKYFKLGLGGSPFEAEVHYKSINNKESYRHYMGVPLFNEDGKKVEKLLLMCIDITEKKGLEKQLATYAAGLEHRVGEQTRDLEGKVKDLTNTETAMMNILEDLDEEKTKLEEQFLETKKFLKAVESSNEATLIIDKNGIILYANEAAENITGYSINNLVGDKPDKWCNGESCNIEKIFEKVGKFHKPVIIDVKNRNKTGKEYESSVTVYPIVSRNKIEYYVWIERDITKEKEVDRAKTEFVSLASHQLRTPLTSINWYAEMLESGDAGKLAGKQKEFVIEIYNSSKRMSELVNSLLNVSRIEMGTYMIDPKPLEVTLIADESIKEMEPQYNKKYLKIVKDYSKKIPPVNLDRDLVRIVFQNLISNAIKYTPEKGKITVSIDKDKKDLFVKIADTGYGIPKKDQKKIFTKFFRSDNAKLKDPDGSGLGLYIVRRAVEKSGGIVSFISKENKGTIFSVVIPLKGMVKKEGTKKLT